MSGLGSRFSPSERRQSPPPGGYKTPEERRASEELGARGLLNELRSITDQRVSNFAERGLAGSWVGRFLVEGLPGRGSRPLSPRHHVLQATPGRIGPRKTLERMGDCPGLRLPLSDATGLHQRGRLICNRNHI